MTKHQRARYILISVLMLLLFNFPLLSAANKKIMIGEIPLLYGYVAGAWLLSIALLWLTSTQTRGTQKHTDE